MLNYKQYPPMGHQLQAMRKAWPMREFALFHEMGTGKTYTTINLAAARFLKGQITALVVICPTPIKNVWVEQLEEHCPVDYSYWVLESGDQSWNWAREPLEGKLKVFIIGVEALSIQKGQAIQQLEFFRRFNKFLCVVDESSRIKNADANRTKNVIDVGGWADYRMILTGTPVTQGLEDLFGQFAFLNKGILDCRNFVVFRRRYCVMGGFKNKQILGYQFEEHLYEKIKPYTDYVTKDECLDLPDKLYPPPIIVQPTDNQRRVMKQLQDEFSAEDGDKEIIVSTILERMTRYQQVIGGSFPFEEEGGYDTKPIEGKNPKLEATLELIDGLPATTKVIVWARFVPEIRYLLSALRERYGAGAVVDFYGPTADATRARNSRLFQDPNSGVRFMVSNQTVGGYGQTWTAATYIIYYSNSFSYEDRYQSEDRCHRKGQNNHVTYQDIEMAVPEDRMILRAIRKKRDLAQEVEEALNQRQHRSNTHEETREVSV